MHNPSPYQLACYVAAVEHLVGQAGSLKFRVDAMPLD
jgi:hypothetical protein